MSTTEFLSITKIPLTQCIQLIASLAFYCMNLLTERDSGPAPSKILMDWFVLSYKSP